MLLMIDNYDSFTYTLVQYFQSLDQDVKVVRNDELSIAAIKSLNPEHIVISPGPCSPNEAGLSLEIIKQFYQTTPIFGVCLGHQSIAQAFGADVIKAKKVMHGKTSLITHSENGLFRRAENPLQVTRYHSLIVDHNTLPDFIQPTAWGLEKNNVKDELMALQLKDYPVAGVQFHPESVLTHQGMLILDNFLKF